jgi:hypothetical protein
VFVGVVVTQKRCCVCVPRNKSVTDTRRSIGASDLTSHDTALRGDVVADGAMLMLQTRTANVKCKDVGGRLENKECEELENGEILILYRLSVRLVIG